MQTISRQARKFAQMGELRSLLDALPTVLLVLNPQRQIIFANRSMLDLVGASDQESLCGRRPGEVLDCEHAAASATGGKCGTTEACTTCGAAIAIASCLDGQTSVQECRIMQRATGKALDLRITARPFHVDGQSCTLVALNDISHEKRRAALERIFFHDLLNTAGAVAGYAELLGTAQPHETGQLGATISRLAGSLVEGIRAQRELADAENNQLPAPPLRELVHSLSLLGEMRESFRNQEVARGKHLTIDPSTADVQFTSDKSLLSRVIGNMVKNALEAVEDGQTVRMHCRATEEHVEFQVHNPGTMGRQVQLQIFQRSFSTKGPGRGLGTYSMKLLSERYLGGSVSFTTNPQTGTTFTVRIPRSGR